ncbi:MAG: NAD(P)H-dependent oxidoreductase subunit E [Spirochaetales bacterium]|nr:NAD(P)H-dependent oxidoreductase subunit E [Spirochaetales bacterium]
MIDEDLKAADCSCKTDSIIDEMAAIFNENTITEGSLIPILQKAQTRLGYLPVQALRYIAARLNKSLSEVAGVVGFYSFFSTVPRGKYVIRVCLGTACYVRGGKEVLSALEKHLGITVGQTTDDRVFSLEVGRCFGACGLAPVIMINEEVYQRVKPVKVGEILAPYKMREAEMEAVK